MWEGQCKFWIGDCLELQNTFKKYLQMTNPAHKKQQQQQCNYISGVDGAICGVDTISGG